MKAAGNKSKSFQCRKYFSTPQKNTFAKFAKELR